MLARIVQRWGTILLSLAIAVAVWPTRLRFTFDDTFISFRYADHLSRGLGLVWNIGGPHCEGYTNFLYILVLACARLLSVDLLVASQVIGLLSTIVWIETTRRVGQKCGGEAVGWVAALICSVTPLVWVNALSGMETSFFVMLIMLTIHAWISERPSLSLGWALLATLTRPEAGLLALLILLFSLPTADRVHRTLRGFLLFFALPLAIYAAWKLWYFGHLFPNSFYVKVLRERVGGHSHSFAGLQYTRLFVTSVTALVLATVGLSKPNVKKLRLPLAFIALVLIFFVFVLPLEGLYDRFLIPTLPLLAITATVGARDLTRRYNQHASMWIAWGLLLVVHMVITFSTSRTKQAFQAHEDVWDRSMDNIVTVLRTLPDHDSLLVGYGDAGYVMYHSGVQHLDLFALNNTALAHAKTTSERMAVVTRSEPDLLLLPVVDSSECANLIEDAYGAARSGYTAGGRMKVFPYDLVFLVRDGSPRSSALHAALRQEELTGHSGLLAPPACVK